MWKKLPNLLFDVVNHQTININNVIYIIGGYRNSVSPLYEKISIYILSKSSYCVKLRSLETYDWNCINNTISPTEQSVSPIDRFGHTVVIWKDIGILFGGCHDNGYCDPDVYLFIPGKTCKTISAFDNLCVDEEKWVKVNGIGGHFPLRRDGHSADIQGNSMFIYGGLVVSRPRHYDNKLYQLDLKNWQWSVVYQGDYLEPIGRDFCHLLSHNHSLYLFGGRSDGCLNGNSQNDIYDTAVWKFDLHPRDDVRTWKKIHPGHGIICKTVLENDHSGSDRNSTIMTSCPQPRRSFMAAILGDEIIMFGGLYENVQFSVHYNDVWSFNIRNREWRCLLMSTAFESNSGVPVPVRRGTLTKLNNHSMLLIGGVTTLNTVPVDIMKIVGKSIVVPRNSRPVDFDLINGSSMITAINGSNQTSVTIYHKSETPFSGYIEAINDLTLKSTGQVFLLQPQFSLYQKSLAVVVTLYTTQQLARHYVPSEVMRDVESIRISPDSK